jgi:hypothetical protein
MAPRDEKAQSIHWDNPVGSNEERTSFKKKKKFVYLDKYEDTVGELRGDIVSLKQRQAKLWIGIGVVAIVLFMKIFNVI